MAVYTDVGDEELNAFIASYDIGELLSFRGIAEGVENTNYMVDTTKDRFILTLYEKRVAEEDLPFFLQLLDFLSENGIRCPVPVADSEGHELKALAGRPAALFSFLEGIWVRRPRVPHCAAVGSALAQLHLVSASFPSSRPNALSIEGWRPLVAACLADADSIIDGLSHEIATEMDIIEREWPRHLPQGVIHADLFPDNVFFIGDELSGLIDFYFACTDMLAYDVAICINAWCFEADQSFNVTKARALLRGYQAVRPFTTEEFEAIPILTRGAAFRFLLTRLYDWLNRQEGALVAPKDPLEYWRKLRFHRTQSHPRDYAL